jgi:aminopeptidase YwaD
MFDEQEAFGSIEYLASDALHGRLVGTPGNLEAGDYIAACFAEYGLQPAGVDGGFFQRFTSTVTLNVEEPVLAVAAPGASGGAGDSRTYVPHCEYVPRIAGYLGSGDATGQVVWLGQCVPSDFGASLANKIILCAPMEGPEQTQAVEKALQYGVGGLLIIREDDGPYARSAYGFGELIGIPAFRVSYAIVEDLLAGSPYTVEDLDQLGAPTELATTVHMANAFERTERQARNVLGLLPGADPLQRDEIVIVGAHYDHVGVDPDGTIYNGANDNASGVAVMLEIARLWQAQGYRPSHSVLFAAWDAEEQGMYGSKHYVSAPVYPLDETLAYLNLDMAGVGDQVLIYGDDNAMADQLMHSAEALAITPNVEPQYLADDLPFHDAGIPTGYCTFEGESPYSLYLHRPEDDPQIIQPSSLRTIGVIAVHALFSMSVGR